MNNILLIDDEPVIVETLFNMLSRMEHLELIIWKAGSAPEGIEIMKSNRIDILITDVRMPGMSGLELIKHVQKQWSRCKVIFLSGYSDYEYLQTALRENAFDYLLKPIEDEVIVETVQRVIAEIASDLQLQDIMVQSELQLQKAHYLLHKDFFENLLFGVPLTPESIAGYVQTLQIPLDPEQDIILMIGRADRWPQDFQLKDKLLLQYAVNNIVEEYLRGSCRIAAFIGDRHVVWLIQAPPSQLDSQDSSHLQWYINELLEKIQQSIQQYLHLPVSFVLSKPNVGWQQIHHTYKEMGDWLQRGIGLDEGIILAQQASSILSQYSEQELLPQDIKRNINQLTNLLESGDKVTFHHTLTNFFHHMQKAVFLDFTLQLEIFAHLTAMFLSYMNARKITQSIGEQLDLKLLANYGMFANWPAFEDYCSRLAVLLFSYAEGEKKDQKKDIIDKVDAYIIKSLHENTSLDHLAKVFHLSPYYLSRLYHAEKGISLSERMKLLKLARAKELLLVEGIKIQEVALELGFYNVSYFTKFFKKNMGISPQEYKQNNTI
ncbi:response regulator transcription factor [Paenibacillus eucommiae]|uniref:Two-component system response regulator YesN n=1 Tax=Paenibacillus eucommiae TaxID=1355755 RepID=A0ABS4J6U0_9BACL|nr:response regulator [Paenibacillus eucommiae]MBP1994499.1 two-component system response regulator YesN [Paenibacillus eucommiae]